MSEQVNEEQQLEQAGVPADALRRLKELEGKGQERPFFTSDLSVNEFLLVKEAGFEPRGLVYGSSIYHIGLQRKSWSKNQELEKLTGAMYQARELALDRMEAEADVLGADGIVGVRLDINYYDWGRHAAEFIAVGTAVSAKEREGVEKGSWRTPQGKPFTSDLSGQDFWTLVQSGYMPLGLVLGSCVYHVAHRSAVTAMTQTGQNVELDNYTQGLYDARERAMTRMQDQALGMQAEGIVGVHLEEKNHFWGSQVIEFLAVGTAVRPAPGATGPGHPALVLPMDT